MRKDAVHSVRDDMCIRERLIRRMKSKSFEPDLRSALRTAGT
jgi:hypothetical protein